MKLNSSVIIVWIGSVLVILSCSISFAIPEKFVSSSSSSSSPTPIPIKSNLPGLDVEYHISEEDLRKSENIHLNAMWIKGDNGRPVGIYTDTTQPLPVYYTPGSFVYGPSIYVPSYEDSVLINAAK